MTGITRMPVMTRLKGGGGGWAGVFEQKIQGYFSKDTFPIFQGFQSET